MNRSTNIVRNRSAAGVLLHFLFLSRFNRPIAISPPCSFLINRSEPKPEARMCQVLVGD